MSALTLTWKHIIFFNVILNVVRSQMDNSGSTHHHSTHGNVDENSNHHHHSTQSNVNDTSINEGDSLSNNQENQQKDEHPNEITTTTQPSFTTLPYENTTSVVLERNVTDTDDHVEYNGIIYFKEIEDPHFYRFVDPFFSHGVTALKEIQSLLGIPPVPIEMNYTRGQCANGRCAGYPYSAFELYYKKLFYTLDEIRKLDDLNRRGVNSTSGGGNQPGGSGAGNGGGMPGKHGQGGNSGENGPSFNDDGDHCCPTILTHSSVKFLNNTDGIEREIVQFIGGEPPVQQYIPMGECRYQSTVSCKKCIVQKQLHFLLVMDPDSVQFPPVKFDMFFIDSYCSCQGT